MNLTTSMKRSLYLGLVLAVAACGDDGQSTTDTSPDTAVPDTTSPDTSPDTASPDGTDGSDGSEVDAPEPDVSPPLDGDVSTPDDASDVGPDTSPDTAEPRRVYDPIPGEWDEAFVTLLPGLIADLGARAYDAVRDPVGGAIYVGGIFSQIGAEPHLNVAGWRRESGFFALGDGLDITVHALALDAEGALYASGRGASGGFGLGSPNTISVWRDGAWSTLGTTSSFEPVWDILVRGDELIIGGEFYNVTSEDGESSVEAGFLARWDGDTWHAYPEGPNGIVRAIVEHGDDLCVAGSFDRVGDLEVGNVACLGESGWYALGEGLNSQVNALVSGSDGALYAGGYFSFGDPLGPETEFFVGLGRFGGTAWEPVGGGVVLGHITNVWSIAEGPKGGLYVGGDFRQVNAAMPRTANNIARFDMGIGAGWTTFGGVRDDTGNTLLSEGGPRAFVFDGDDVVVAGLFSTVGGSVQAPGIARLVEGPPHEWHPLLEVDGPSLGIAGGINSLSLAPDGDIIAGGGFSSAGGTTTPNVARLTAEGWVSLGAGLDDAVWVVHAASDGTVWAGGRFSGHFGRFADGAWTFPGPVGGHVRAIVEDTDGSLVVGGDFEQVGTASISRIARVIGTTFYPLGEGLNERVNAILLDGEGGIYAGGFFTGTGDYDEEAQTGAMIRGLAYWNGFAWDEVGGGIDGFVRELAWYDGKLLVVGQFELAGETEVSSLALWDGSSWQSIGGAKTFLYPWGSALQLTSVAVQANGFFVAGVFVDHEIGGELHSGVSWWDGERFHPLDVGTNDLVEDLLIAPDGRALWVGGFFKTAGGRPSLSLARWLFADEVGTPVDD